MKSELVAAIFRDTEMTDGPVKGAQNNVNTGSVENLSEKGTCRHPETYDLKILPGT